MEEIFCFLTSLLFQSSSITKYMRSWVWYLTLLLFVYISIFLRLFMYLLFNFILDEMQMDGL